MPFGGVGASGHGRFGGRRGIDSLTETHRITTATQPGHFFYLTWRDGSASTTARCSHRPKPCHIERAERCHLIRLKRRFVRQATGNGAPVA